MRKSIQILIYIMVTILPKTSMANPNALYNFAGILPIIVDSNNQAWIYFGVEYVNNEKRLAALAGKKDNKDKTTLDTALREMNEESLEVFNDYINTRNINKDKNTNKLKEIDYNILYLLSTKIYIYHISSNRSNNNCDEFVELYNQRRYSGENKFQRLKLSQRETFELRKVKLDDLIDFFNNPSKTNYKLTSYGGKNCIKTDSIPLRWSTKVILRNQSALYNLIK